jgi:hypothetical protein
MTLQPMPRYHLKCGDLSGTKIEEILRSHNVAIHQYFDAFCGFPPLGRNLAIARKALIYKYLMNWYSEWGARSRRFESSLPDQ